ncbi:taurine ABC transporter ATP-binding protein [Chthonobacter albigriseus]|uniref:taurine ABC transporter ATP-binding protein n=1 Tax=Chthonobacter albigriseus TaxID=1683161 RepID=UPI0015EE3A5D|nr:ATP-binding cassette domain-containing protein [Chthonobacter albigriseus]
MSTLRLDTVSLSYAPVGADDGLVLDRVDLAVRTRDFVAVIGRSGSGKTSLLNLAAGFLQPTAGSVSVDGKPVAGPGADRAVVFQDDALFPWLSARENVAFALRLKGTGPAERARRADALLERVGLAGAGDKAVWELSGGMRQRVGIARAIAAEPRFLLMDEPLGALDAMTRERMQELLLTVWRDTGAGVLLITHGIEEALFLATRVVVLAPGPGRVEAVIEAGFGRQFLSGRPAREIKADPAFVAARERLRDLIDPLETKAAA